MVVKSILYRATTILFVASALVVTMPGAARADTAWKIGTKVAYPDPLFWLDANQPVPWSEGGVSSGCGLDANGFVKKVGDYVYVTDFCEDGRSAVAKVTWYRGSGEKNVRICRNKWGFETYARCDYDWGEHTEKILVAGLYNGNTGYLVWFNGDSSTWYNG